MLRTIFTIGLFALLGLFALKLAFGILPTVLAIVLWLVWMAIKIALVGLVIWLLIRIFSPETARRLKDRFSSGANY